jgi:hypothetical protein
VQPLINCLLEIRCCWLTDLWKTGDDHLSSLAIAQMGNKVEHRLLLNIVIRKCETVDELLFEDKMLLVN